MCGHLCVCVCMFVGSTCLCVFICLCESGCPFSVCLCGLISHLLFCHLVGATWECQTNENLEKFFNSIRWSDGEGRIGGRRKEMEEIRRD